MKTLFSALILLSLSIPAGACPPGSRCLGEPGSGGDLSELTGCKEMKKVPKIRAADTAAHKSLNLLDKAGDDADTYKASCDAPATQDSQQLQRIYREGNTAGDTSGRARQATDEAKGLLNEIAKPLNDLGMQECIGSVKETFNRITQAKAKLDTKGAALGKCGALDSGKNPAGNSGKQPFNLHPGCPAGVICRGLGNGS